MTPLKAIFAAGCFWGVEAGFRSVPGVVQTEVGYTGGKLKRPTYDDVCSDTTGHAEAVLVLFDPAVVSYEELLAHFWSCHDPTTRDGQGPDHGSQYRSAIFFHDPAQELAALSSRDRAQKRHPLPVTTEIVSAATFWSAEDYHQQFYEKRGLTRCAI